ncbi:MAG: glycosyltransferase family 2 protein [Cyclobacteriaceae bacterium]
MSTYPLVSVIIPTYNYGQFIKESIKSVYCSDYPTECIELIVVDDGSTDDTKEQILKSKFTGLVLYKRIENTKKAGAIRTGIELANGKYIFTLDADDIFESKKIIKTVKIFESDDEIVHSSNRNQYLNSKNGTRSTEHIPIEYLNKKIEGKYLLNKLYKSNKIFGGGSTFAGRSSILKKLIIPNEVGTIVDEFLVLNTLEKGYTYFFEDLLTTYRVHDSSDSSDGLNVNKMFYFNNCKLEILKQLKQNNSSVALLYELKYTVSRMYELQLKDCFDINVFFKLIKLTWLISVNYNFESFYILKSYGIFKRLLPPITFKIFKLIKNKMVNII